MGALDFWLRIAGFASTLNPPLVEAFLYALRDIRDRIPESEVERLIRIGDVVGAAALIMSAPTSRHAFNQFQGAIRDAVAKSAKWWGREIPVVKDGGNILRVQFDVLDARTVTAVRQFEAAVLKEAGKTIEGAIIQAVEDGLSRGINPRTIARGIRDVVGLTPTQEVWVRNFRDELIRGDAAVFERKLLDRRFASTIRKAFAGDGLTAKQIDVMVASYRKRMIAYHAETVARTVGINAMKLGQLEIWKQSVDQGIVAEEDIERGWRTKMDGRERETHAEMNGATTTLNGTWNVPGVGPVTYPGEKEFNCRCAQLIKLKTRRRLAEAA